MRQRSRLVWLITTGIGAGAAAAQEPTEAQINAIRESCRSDYAAQCEDVPAGGKEALQCLQAHLNDLTQGCEHAVSAIARPAVARPPRPVPVLRQTPRPPSVQAAPPAQEVAPEATWPHTIRAGDASATVYQPQPTAWPDHTTLTARAVVAIQPAGQTTPILGTIEIEAATRTDLDRRTVSVSDIKVLSTHFPSLDTEQAARADAHIKAVAAGLEAKQVPLDTLLLALRDAPAEVKPAKTDNTPPVIFHSEYRASLLVFDGDPVLAKLGDSGLAYVVNTNWDVVTDPTNGRWFLLNNGAWLAAPVYTGPYQPVTTLPAAFGKLPDDGNFAEMRKAVPGRVLTPGEAPTVFVSLEPSEIIVTDGPAKLAPVAGTKLQFVVNTDADVIFDPAGAQYYFLTSGRWFSAPSLDGPWTYATPTLPAEFARIPPDGPHADLLASVPGTQAAQEALISTQIPTQATLKRDTTTQVAYVGAPEFRPIPDTSLRYAVNTTAQVIEVDGKYYDCDHGAWFVAAAPTGPWVLADSVPPAIYTIPSSSPVYPVTYVHVYSATPEAVVTGYTAGYLMGMVSAAGVVVYGTGYYYPPVVVPAPVPVFLPYPYSYAGGVAYNPATGAWARGGGVSGPYGTAAAGTVYNPATGAYAHGAEVYGPYGGAAARSAYNPTTGAYAHGSAAWGPNGGSANGSFYNPTTGRSGSTTQNWNPYSRWGSSTVSGPNQTVHTASGSNANGSAGAFSSSTGAEGAGVHGAGGNNAGVVKGPGGDVYAGHDGNVYQHTDSGWSKYSNGGWQPVTPPKPPTSQPPREASGQSPAGQSPVAQNPVAQTPAVQTPAARTQTQQPGTASRQETAAAVPPQATSRQHAVSNSESYTQLENDRRAREGGQYRQQRYAQPGSGQEWRRRGAGWGGSQFQR